MPGSVPILSSAPAVSAAASVALTVSLRPRSFKVLPMSPRLLISVMLAWLARLEKAALAIRLVVGPVAPTSPAPMPPVTQATATLLVVAPLVMREPLRIKVATRKAPCGRISWFVLRNLR